MRKLFGKFQWSLSNRLLLATAFALILTSGIAVQCLRQIGKMVEVTSMITDTLMPNIQGVAEIRNKVQNLRGLQWEMIAVTEKTKRDSLINSIDTLKGDLFIYNKTFSSRISEDESQASFEEYSLAYGEYEEMNDKIVELVKADKALDAVALLRDKGGEVFAKIDDTTKTLDGLSYRGSQRASEAVAEGSRLAKLHTAIAAPFFFIISMTFLTVLIRSTSKRFSALASRLDGSAQEITGLGQILSTTSEKLSSATTSEASAIVETSQSINLIQERIAETTKIAQNTAQAIGQTRERADVGNRAIEEVSSAMRRIEESNRSIMSDVEKSHVEMQGITKIMQTIGSKAQVINDIVFQTKLLSFNASVEAARAGEHGKGFSVVAGEMGELARVSGEAAKDIGTILDSSSKSVDEILANMKLRIGGAVKTSSDAIHAGSERTQICSRALSEIVTAAEEASSLASNIVTAATEQESSILEINKAVGQLTELTSQNSTLADDTLQEAHNLLRQADELQEIVSAIEVEVEGKAKVGTDQPQTRASAAQQEQGFATKHAEAA